MESTLAKVVAANVRAQAALRGMTQTQVAAAVGLAQPAVSDRYRERRQWQLEDLERLGEAFGLDPAELLARPKGFEPLTFWFGASSLTAWKDPLIEVAWGDGGGAWRIFCDRCGYRWFRTLFDGDVDGPVFAEVHSAAHDAAEPARLGGRAL